MAKIFGPLYAQTSDARIPANTGANLPHRHFQTIVLDGAGVIRLNGAGAITHYHQGLPRTSDGRLAVEIGAEPAYHHNGIAFAASGRVCMQSAIANFKDQGHGHRNNGCLAYITT